jgi:hypothetical protein
MDSEFEDLFLDSSQYQEWLDFAGQGIQALSDGLAMQWYVGASNRPRCHHDDVLTTSMVARQERQNYIHKLMSTLISDTSS